MAFLGIRFDFRDPGLAGTSTTDRYRAGLDMVEWADRQGFLLAVLSEHHGSDDGYLPSPLPMAAAFAARTTNIRLRLSALVTSLHDPLRLAEDLAVVDLISGGRVDVTLTNGYVVDEFAMFGRPLSERARRTSEAVEVLRQAWTGEPFSYQGRTVRVRPAPDRPIPITLGGSTPAAARRAARIADGFSPSTNDVWDAYRDECLALGKPDPGPPMGGDTSVVHVAKDPDAVWELIAPYAMHETNAYAHWAEEAGIAGATSYGSFDSPESLRASGAYRVLTPEQLVAELAPNPFGFAMFHPLLGGLPPELGWESLRLVESDVLPALRAAAG